MFDCPTLTRALPSAGFDADRCGRCSEKPSAALLADRDASVSRDGVIFGQRHAGADGESQHPGTGHPLPPG